MAKELWIWKKRVPKGDDTLWEDRLFEVPNVVVSEDVTQARAVVSAYCTAKDEAEALQARFGGAVERVEDRDWVAESARSEPPVVIRKALVVTQEVDPEALERLGVQYPGRRVLSVPAQMAFGTGQHATTSTCLRMLADVGKRRKPGWSMVDIGTGSGLLAFGAREFGAAAGKVDAFDFDPKSVEVSEENAERNGITGIRFFEADVLKWKPPRRYDVVAANLYSGLLEKALPKMFEVAEAGADLILSGILRSQLKDVITAARKSGFSVLKTVQRGKWAGVLGNAGG